MHWWPPTSRRRYTLVPRCITHPCSGLRYTGAPSIETVKLNNGVEMPRIGFGTAGLGCARSLQAVQYALDAGAPTPTITTHSAEMSANFVKDEFDHYAYSLKVCSLLGVLNGRR